jgi:hypothetical protein
LEWHCHFCWGGATVSTTTENKKIPFFEHALCTLDGSFLEAIMDEERVKRERRRKGFVAQNVLGVIHFDGYWIYVLAGLEGSAHDGQVFNDALLRRLPVFEGKYYFILLFLLRLRMFKKLKLEYPNR